MMEDYTTFCDDAIYPVDASDAMWKIPGRIQYEVLSDREGSGELKYVRDG
jgi:hypothetical protein